MCIPGLSILLVIVSITGTSIPAMIFILSLGGIVGSRLIRSTVIRIKEDMYLAAATAIGSGTLRILWRHVLPNILAPTIVAFTGSVPGMILAEAGLSFLGFGLGPPTPSWGCDAQRTGALPHVRGAAPGNLARRGAGAWWCTAPTCSATPCVTSWTRGCAAAAVASAAPRPSARCSSRRPETRPSAPEKPGWTCPTRWRRSVPRRGTGARFRYPRGTGSL